MIKKNKKIRIKIEKTIHHKLRLNDEIKNYKKIYKRTKEKKIEI